MAPDSSRFLNKKVLLTGTFGTLEQQLVTRLLSLYPKQIIFISRTKTEQMTDMNKSGNDLLFLISNLGDRMFLREFCKGIDYIFHLLPMKDVSLCENQPFEAIQSNIIGTQNVIEAAVENKSKIVFYLTAYQPPSTSNLFGLTQRVADKLFATAKRNNPEILFISLTEDLVFGEVSEFWL